MRMVLSRYLMVFAVILSSCSSSNEVPKNLNPPRTAWSSILVRICDHDGTPLPSAAVFLKSNLRDTRQVAISDADGVAKFTLFAACTDCRLDVSLAGFAHYGIDHFEINTGESLELDIELELLEGPFEVSTDCYPHDLSPLHKMPNQPFQADPDPRERGSGPLNSNR